jgi:hypothetical protein
MLRKSIESPTVTLCLCAFISLAAMSAEARDTEVTLSAKAAAESDSGQSALFDVPFFMKGQKHPPVEKNIKQVSTHQSTRGAFRGDDSSCRVAFLSSMKVLQSRAQDAGGDAVIDIVSITREKKTESATDFRCVAGTFVVHVGLRGTIVKLKE